MRSISTQLDIRDIHDYYRKTFVKVMRFKLRGETVTIYRESLFYGYRTSRHCFLIFFCDSNGNAAELYHWDRTYKILQPVSNDYIRSTYKLIKGV